MTKRQFLFLILAIAFGAMGAYLLFSSKQESKTVEKPEQGIPLKSSATKIDGRKVLNLPPGDEKETIAKLKVRPIEESDWEDGLKKNLRAQGGAGIEIRLTKLESFMWAINDTAIPVESVKIELEDKGGRTSKFNALIDSNSGKILQTWNQPIVDPVNPREVPGVKIDPRYLTE
jgi:hypothetical protein